MRMRSHADATPHLESHPQKGLAPTWRSRFEPHYSGTGPISPANSAFALASVCAGGRNASQVERRNTGMSAEEEFSVVGLNPCEVVFR